MHTAFQLVCKTVLQLGGIKAQVAVGLQPRLAVKGAHGQHVCTARVLGVWHGQARGGRAVDALGFGLRAPAGVGGDLPFQAARYPLFARRVAVHKTAAPAGSAVQPVAQSAVGIERAREVKLGTAQSIAARTDLHRAQRLGLGLLADVVHQATGRDLPELQRGRALDDFHAFDVEQRRV